MRLLLNAGVLGMCLLSTSCTAILWNKGLNGPVVRHDRKEVVIVKDEIASFAQLKTADAANKFLIVAKNTLTSWKREMTRSRSCWNRN